jgi:hypothetical protein
VGQLGWHGVEGDGLAEVVYFRLQLGLDEVYGVIQEDLEGGVGDPAQEARQVTLARETGVGVEAPGIAPGWDQWEAQQPEQGWMLDQILA